MEDLLDLMYSRRSIRDYTGEPVSDEDVESMLKAAMAAPSARNLQPWHFVVVRDREVLDELAEVHKYAYMLEKAPMAIVVCGDQEVSKKHWVEDTCAATQNLLLAATALGLGGVWISLYPKKKYQKAVRELLEIPDHVGVLCALAVGHPAERKKARTQYDEKCVHQEAW
ncbi:MAG: nitroreductase family protein [Anaerolineae bacterium]|jgi:nitroreductase